MTMTIHENLPIASIPRASGLWKAVAAWWIRRRERQEHRLTLAELSRMNAYMLDDMGLTPGDVESAIRNRQDSVLLNKAPRDR